MKISFPNSHLFYIIENRIAGDKYSGLSHVAEHALLIPTDIGKAFRAKGYTCINHVFLSFSSPQLTILQEIDNLIMSGNVVTEEIANIAKKQVMWEIADTSYKTAISMQIQCFVTDDRIASHAIGGTDEVKKIQTADILEWLNQKIQSGQVHRYLFNSSDEIVEATQYAPRTSHFQELEIQQQDGGSPKTLFIASLDKTKTVRMYFRIPSLLSKIDVLQKGFVEYCIQRKLLSALEIDADIYDKFFDVNERYVLVEFAWDQSKRPYGAISSVLSQMKNISYEEFLLYRTDFLKLLSQLIPQSESAYQRINAIKNEIVYAYPHIKPNDFCLIERINYSSFLKSQKMYGPVKIVFL